MADSKSRRVIAPWQRLCNLVNAVWRFFIALIHARGNLRTVMADRQVAEERLLICFTCPELRNNETCALCGCYVRLKAQLMTEHCPKHEW